MNKRNLHTFGILAALGSMAVIGAITPAFALPNGQANPVAFAANSNQGYMEICMLEKTA